MATILYSCDACDEDLESCRETIITDDGLIYDEDGYCIECGSGEVDEVVILDSDRGSCCDCCC